MHQSGHEGLILGTEFIQRDLHDLKVRHALDLDLLAVEIQQLGLELAPVR
jgi:hypothetical protein